MAKISRIDQIYQSYESIQDKIVYQIDQGIDALSRFPGYLLKIYNSIIESILDRIYDIANKDTRLARLLRFISLPWSVIIPKGYKYFFSQHGKALIFTPGVHMIRAKVGGGKSLASFVLAEIYLEETGLSSYFTSPVEKPSITADGEWLYVFHRVINLDDYYDKEGKKVLNFNTTKYKAIHKDEVHLEFNPRLFNTSDYKTKYIAQQKDEILMRHEGMEYIFKYSQYMKLDSQDMDALTYMHDVETVKDIPVKRWVDTGELKYIPIKLKFTTYTVEILFDGRMKRKKVGSCKIPVPYELLDRFDTHAERYRHAGLPVDYK